MLTSDFVGYRPRIHYPVRFQYSTEDCISLFSASNLRVIQKWTDPCGLYNLFLLERPPFHFPLICQPTAAVSLESSAGPLTLCHQAQQPSSPFNVPTVGEWHEVWKSWDLITLGMIPRSMLHEKPIDLRHKCLFYLGHIPACVSFRLLIRLSTQFLNQIPGYSSLQTAKGTKH
jgi:L-histidine Nalpha-methyltransferase / hercynylcysteine S-oxide synthase